MDILRAKRARQVAQRGAEIAEGAPHRAARGADRARIAHPEEERHHEDEVPEGCQRAHEPGPLARFGIEPEGRVEPDEGRPGLPALGEEDERLN